MLGQKPDEDIRLPMQWSYEVNAGFTSGHPWRQPNANFREFNVEVMQNDSSSLLNHYKRLIQLRSSRGNRGYKDTRVYQPDSLRQACHLILKF